MLWQEPFLIFFAIHQLLYWVYVWQLKEYRFDRWWDWLVDDNTWWWKQFNVIKWYRPKMTIRALSILGLGLGLIIWGWRWWWLFGILIVMLLVKIEEPIFSWQKRKIIVKAKKKMGGVGGVVIGVTGSFGKSTSKEMLVEVLSKKYRVVSTPKNVNTEIGVAQTVLKWSEDFEVAVVEMGAYKIGEIKAICDIVLPKYGVITGLGDQHLSLFGSLENIRKAKYELIDSLPKEGRGWVIDKNFSIDEAKNIKEYRDGVGFDFDGEKIWVPLLGKQLISNVIVVIKVAEELGMKKREIIDRLKKLNTNNYWPKMIKVSDDLVVVDNSYNASLNSFLSLLEYLKVWKGYRKILVTPGMIELGKNGSRDHEEVGKRLEDMDIVLLTSGKYFKEMNCHGNVIKTRLDDVVSKINENIKGKTMVVFKSRIPNYIINQICNGKSY